VKKKSILITLCAFFVIALCVVSTYAENVTYLSDMNLITAHTAPVANYAENVTYLSDMNGVADENCLLFINDKTESGGKINIGGTEYDKGLITHPGFNGPGTVTYNIDGLGYTNFRAIVGKDKSAGAAVGEEGIVGTNINVQVYVDGVLIVSSGNLPYPSTYTIDVDITDAKELKIVSGDGGDGIYCDTTAWADAKLVKLTVTGIEMANLPRCAYKVNEQLDINGAMVKINYSDGSSTVTELSESMLSGYDLSNAGKQNVTVTTKGKTCRFEIYVTDEAEYVTDSLISNYSGYTANPGVNKNCDGGELNIAGKQYTSGFGVHPAADGSGAIIDLNVEGCGYKYMTITCGKDLSCTNAWGVEAMLNQCAVSFNVLADGVTVADSGNVFYGTCFHYIISLDGVKTVQLKVNDVDGITCDASDWVNLMMFNMPLDAPITENPSTGDSSWIGILTVLFFAISGAVIFRRKVIA
jgi:hypothetical protein